MMTDYDHPVVYDYLAVCGLPGRPQHTCIHHSNGRDAASDTGQPFSVGDRCCTQWR